MHYPSFDLAVFWLNNHFLVVIVVSDAKGDIKPWLLVNVKDIVTVVERVYYVVSYEWIPIFWNC